MQQRSVAISGRCRSYRNNTTTTTTTTILRPFFRDHPGEPVLEENFWTLWCKGRLTEADTLTIRLGATPSGLTSAHQHHPSYFLRVGCPSCRPPSSVKALKAKLLFVLSVLGTKRGGQHTQMNEPQMKLSKFSTCGLTRPK